MCIKFFSFYGFLNSFSLLNYFLKNFLHFLSFCQVLKCVPFSLIAFRTSPLTTNFSRLAIYTLLLIIQESLCYSFSDARDFVPHNVTNFFYGSVLLSCKLSILILLLTIVSTNSI